VITSSIGLGTATGDARVRHAAYAVYATFIGAGFGYATWASRIPQIRAGLGVTPGELGLILLSGAVGATSAPPLSGLVIAWLGETRTVAVMSLVSSAGLACIGLGYRYGVLPVIAGLVLATFGGGTWDVAMNVQGAAVEQGLRRSIMSKFHAGWSIGTVAGAGAGAAMVALNVPVTVHLLAAAVILAVTMPLATRRYLPRAGREPAGHERARRRDAHSQSPGERAQGARGALRAWAEPRTLLIGLFVLCMTFTEGTGNDWLSLAVIDGYHTRAVTGTLALTLFLAGMTTARWLGPAFLDRYGRIPVLRVCAATALAGLALAVFGGLLAVALAGALLMGLGTSLGFPTGMSAAADEPRYAPGRVSVVASVGYLAFLAGPPSIGFLADHLGVLHAISAAGLLLAVAFFLAGVMGPAGHDSGDDGGTGPG
jgi:MFS family permease